jgi:hypothetical protein
MKKKEAKKVERDIRDRIGTKVLLTGDHPNAGNVGTFEGVFNTVLGLRPMVSLADGTKCFITKNNQWEPI